MPSTFNLSDYMANDLAKEVNNQVDSATLTIYDGGQPANANTGLGGGNHSCAVFTLPAKAANTVGATGVITFGAIADTTWTLSTAPSFARITSGGNVLFDCSVGTAGTDIIINASPVVLGAVAHIVAGPTYTVTE